MPSKTEEYLALAQQTAKELTRYWENWTDYLTTASRLYKYSFADQLMIYAQRPDATACASFDIWNNRMNRYVRRGSKGIALLDQSSSVPRLHYVFDVSDTGVRRNSRDPEVWQLGPDLVQPVSEMIAREYGVYHERLSQQISDLTGKLVDSYWDNNSGDILDIVDGSFLIDYDEAGQEFQFKSAAAISILYMVLERCGLEPDGHFDRDDFQAIFSFSTPAALYALGTAVSECSRDVLRNIERTVKTTIRRRNVERSQYEYEQQERDLLDRRGLPAPEPDPAPAGESTGQIRQTAPDLPDEASPGAVQFDAPVGDSASAPVGSGTDRREPDAADHAGTAEAEPGSEQRAASDGVGAAHEQPESTGRGTGDERADNFEYDMAMALTGIDSVRWWHRNPTSGRNAFCLNAFRNHYPDFIVMTNSGKVLLVETKGDQLENAESREKIKLGRAWQNAAGSQYRYYMVFQNKDLHLEGAYRFDEFLKILGEL